MNKIGYDSWQTLISIAVGLCSITYDTIKQYYTIIQWIHVHPNVKIVFPQATDCIDWTDLFVKWEISPFSGEYTNNYHHETPLA